MKYLILLLLLLSCNREESIKSKNITDYYEIAPSLYGETIKLVICSPEEAKEKVDSSYNFSGLEGLTISEKGYIIIWISDTADESTLVHESFHATCSIMSWVGIT